MVEETAQSEEEERELVETKKGLYAGRKASPVKVISMDTGEIVRTERAYDLPELKIARRVAKVGSSVQKIEQRRKRVEMAKRRRARSVQKRQAGKETAK